jgi:hypothetical protein
MTKRAPAKAKAKSRVQMHASTLNENSKRSVTWPRKPRFQPELVGVPVRGRYAQRYLALCFCFRVLVLFRDGAAWLMRCIT